MLPVRHPCGVAVSLAMTGPRVFGATPLDHVARKRAPARGASYHTPRDVMNGFCTTQMRHPLSQSRLRSEDLTVDRCCLFCLELKRHVIVALMYDRS